MTATPGTLFGRNFKSVSNPNLPSTFRLGPVFAGGDANTTLIVGV